jgi:uncharacterized protein YbbC (DUF1343 family)/CubicO group peptidase (beta-lactamase class C family)
VNPRRRPLAALLIRLAAAGWALAAAAGVEAGLLPEPLAAIAPAVEAAIAAGEAPGAVVVIGHSGRVVLRRAFGHRRLRPPRPMRPDAIFDLSSLTKVVATTPAVLQLVEEGRLQLDAPVARYWPEFGCRGKERIRLRQLLTHYSGLRPGLPPRPAWSGRDAALEKIAADAPVYPPGSRFTYSDLNFIVLGELVTRASGEPFDSYCRRRIFEPLGMTGAGFSPPASLRERLVPTLEGGSGVVHDPDTRRMGGVSGSAGLFASADDLALFAQALLDAGCGRGRRPLAAHRVAEMVQPHSPAGKEPARGLGWVIHSPGGEWSPLLPPGSFGHKGYTGTLLWIDPATETYLIVLSNRVYPDGEARQGNLRDRLFSLAIQAAGRSDPPPPAAPTAAVMTGIDVLATDHFTPLHGKRVGLITNHSGLDAVGRRTIDLLAKAPGVRLRALFSPEHGLAGKAEWKVASGRDASTDLPVHSLYGDTKRPTPEMLKGLDVLVFDVQDAGARFYTYMSTMGYAMEAAAKAGLRFVVLDRPNPITASRVEGPLLDPDLRSFTAYFPLPVRHGMTMGELAQIFNAESRIGVDLTVVAMQGYRREMWYEETGLAWVNPSPNLRSLTPAALYPGVALCEGSNVSVGRGTDTPFELLGAPWIDAEELTAFLRSRPITGVSFEPARFTPAASIFKGEECRGIRIELKDRDRLEPVMLGIELLCALQRLYPGTFQLDPALHLVGSRAVIQAVAAGEPPESIAASWQPQLEEFRRKRARYLLY